MPQKPRALIGITSHAGITQSSNIVDGSGRVTGEPDISRDLVQLTSAGNRCNCSHLWADAA